MTCIVGRCGRLIQRNVRIHAIASLCFRYTSSILLSGEAVERRVSAYHTRTNFRVQQVAPYFHCQCFTLHVKYVFIVFSTAPKRRCKLERSSTHRPTSRFAGRSPAAGRRSDAQDDLLVGHNGSGYDWQPEIRVPAASPRRVLDLPS